MSDAKKEIESGNWFVDLMMTFAPDNPHASGTPDEMISSASWKAFGVSTAAGLAPGPFGLATVLPEIIAVTKIQIDLIYNIAAYHKQEAEVTPTLVVMIFAGQAKVQGVRAAVERVGTRVIVREVSKGALRPIAQRVGAAIGTKITARLVGRWIPVVVAPIFGAWSKSITTDIGEEAKRYFGGELVVIKPTTCPNGHEVAGDAKFCSECGSAVATGA